MAPVRPPGWSHCRARYRICRSVLSLVFVGSRPSAEVVDVAGATVLPDIDSHCHVRLTSLSQMMSCFLRRAGLGALVASVNARKYCERVYQLLDADCIFDVGVDLESP